MSQYTGSETTMDINHQQAWFQELIAKGLYHAALDVANELVISASCAPEYAADLGELFNETAKVHMALTNYHQTVEYCNKAISHARDQEAWVKYNINLAATYRRLSEFDTFYRYLTPLYQHMDVISPRLRGYFLLNLSASHGINGFYEEAITSAEQSLAAFSQAGVQDLDSVLYNNIGIAHLESGKYEQAEYYLRKALDITGPTMDLIAELGRLSVLNGAIEKAVRYAKQATSMVWSSIINYEKEEIARLCNLLSSISIRLQEERIAIRLAEKAQVFYGQLGMWRQWQDIAAEISRLEEYPLNYTGENSETTISVTEIHHFLDLLDAMNSQELIHKNISKLLDTRVHYAQILADALNLSEQQREDLVLSSRFADYGLTALENEVAVEPNRSEQAYEQYKQHPALSVRMIKMLHLPERVDSIILDHHEHFDGTGFPLMKKQGEINFLARVLRVVDWYVEALVIHGKKHYEVIGEIVGQSGRALDPDVVKVFVGIFNLQQS